MKVIKVFVMKRWPNLLIFDHVFTDNNARGEYRQVNSDLTLAQSAHKQGEQGNKKETAGKETSGFRGPPRVDSVIFHWAENHWS